MQQRMLSRAGRLGFVVMTLTALLVAGCRNKVAEPTSSSSPSSGQPAVSSAESQQQQEPAVESAPEAVPENALRESAPDDLQSGQQSNVTQAAADKSDTTNASKSSAEPSTSKSIGASEATTADASKSEKSEKSEPDKPETDLRPSSDPAATTGVDRPTAKSATPSDAPPKSEGAKKERDELFVGWPKPQFALVITGQQMGYIEPCGCTGLTNQKGGLARRHTLIKQLGERGWPILPVDAGNQVRRFGRQSEIKFQVTADALKKIGYRSIAFGVDDLRLSVGELASVTLPSDGDATPFVSANAAVLDRALIPTHHVAEVGGKKVGITSVLGKDLHSKIVGGDVPLTSPEAGLDVALRELKEAKCDLLVLLAHASIEESEALARKYPDFQVVITAAAGDGRSEPAFLPEPVPGTKSLMVQVGLKGMFVGVLGFYDDPQTPWRYQRVPLDDRFEDSREMLAMLASYQEQLKTLGFENLGLKPLPHPSGFGYTGSAKCGECHTKAFAIWEGTPHAHATDSLVHPPERSEIARHFDPECLSCHVTGWNPQRYYPYASGFLSIEDTPALTASGCENCHGPGSAHVAAESGEGNPTDEKLKELRASMRLPLASAQSKCIECHDIDNSPDFHDEGAFQRYWKQVEHSGRD